MSSRLAEHGFTLLEVLVVVAMVAVLVTSVSLAMAPNPARVLDDEAWRFARVLEAAAEAGEQGQIWTLEWRADGYALVDAAGRPAKADTLFAPHRWPEGVAGVVVGAAQKTALWRGDRAAELHVTLAAGEFARAVTLSPLGLATVEDAR
ncbi:prepilin-type N-terminal cleavage/methylation domain-containing protein [Crenobacter cavernae]|uniref:Type II secretion system protein GspH n=1 Tax=Crenobacter cavernae TaxID=2290923 RepID=A0A345Y9H1_9NEIS|nr:prepilin-type N-terminal cleavage/methylation domain-containing protein [Crenobacter cavernae]AXK40573.1 type II secretion system protein GspH [Crenobacter cavernae]